jgi:aldose 1-epimerase
MTTPGTPGLELTAGDVSVTVDVEHGSRLASVRWRGSELLVGNDGSAFGWGSYVMAPWPGRIRNGRFRWLGRDVVFPANMGDHAIHGTVFDTPWTVDDSSSWHASLSIGLGHPWPFGGVVRHTVRVTESGLHQELSVTADLVAMPAAMGLHPWWRREVDGASGPLSLEADWSGAAMYRRDDAWMSTGELVTRRDGRVDDCFVGVRNVSLLWPGLVRLSLASDARCLVVYDEPDHAICVEPQTAPPDAVNLDPGSVFVAPGASTGMHATWTFAAVS